MIPEVMGGMIRMMMAKFIMNDMPHAAGVLDNDVHRQNWVDYGWMMLGERTIPHGIYLDKMAEEGLADGSVTQLGLRKYKTTMGGYYLIATDVASDEVVNTVYGIIKSGVLDARRSILRTEGMPVEEFVKSLRREEGVPEDRPILTAPLGSGYLAAVERLLWIGSKMRNGTRLDKVDAIDAVMHLEHEEGSYVGWLIGIGIRNSDLDLITVNVVEVLSR